MNLFKCLECNKDYVPEIIICSIDPPEGLSVIGQPKFIETRIVKHKKKAKREQHAIQVSEKVFFLEYQLHSQLIKRMKFLCKNSIFGLRISIVVAQDTITGIATGTALCLRALPLPAPLKIKVNARTKEWNKEDKKFFGNLEGLSQFYIEQTLKSDIYLIKKPHYFMQ